MNIRRLRKEKLRAQRSGSMRQLAKVTHDLGVLHAEMGNMQEALEAYSEELQAYEMLGDKLNCARAHRMIGDVHSALYDWEEAIKHQHQHLEGAQEMENQLEEQRACANLGRAYLCLAETFPEKSDKQIESLAKSGKYSIKGIDICNKLQGIPEVELKKMRGRLLLNLGLVREAQMQSEPAVNFIKMAADIFSQNNLAEDLHKSHLALGDLYEKQENYELSLKYLNLASETEDVSNKAIALLAKVKLFLKNGEWLKARKVLVQLYPGKDLLPEIRENIEKQLRITITLCRAEAKLTAQSMGSNIQQHKFKIYEELGDAAVAACCYNKALEYYQEMLLHAEEIKSDYGIAEALVSLARTFADAGRHKEALPFARRELDICTNGQEACSSALFLADLLKTVKAPSTEISSIYKYALSQATQSEDALLKLNALKTYLDYLETLKVMSAEVEIIRNEVERLSCKIPEHDSEIESSENLDIGVDICLDDLSDLEEQKEDRNTALKTPRAIRTGRKCLVQKRNEKGETQLHVACINNNITRVEKLLNEGHSTNCRDNCGWTPLHEAANHGFVEVAKLLINAGADVNDPGGLGCKGITPLLDAAYCGHFAIMNLLIKKGADIYATTKDGDTTLDSLEDWRKRVSELSDEVESEYKYVHNKLCAMGVPRRKEINRANNDMAKQNRNRRVLIVDEKNKDREVNYISAGEVYKHIMDTMRKGVGQVGRITTASTVQKNIEPLIDSEEVLLDEWLDDDIGRNANTKRTCLNDPCSTAKRKSGNLASGEEMNSKRRKTILDADCTTIISTSDGEESCDSSSTSISGINRESEKASSRKIQSSLFSAGFSRTSVSRTPSPWITTDGLSMEQSQTSVVNLQVLIEEKLLKLQLSVSEEEQLTAESIIAKIQQKFEDETGCRPDLDLVAPNGKTITCQESVDVLLPFETSVTLSSVIKKMDIPPISARYTKICEVSGIEIEEEMMKCLRNCENGTIFRLRGCEASDSEILPLLKSLEYQFRLQVLHLSGAVFYDLGETLSRCLEKLNSLQELHLRCCDIDGHCLGKIQKFPAQLRILDLSYNPLGIEGTDQLHRLLSSLKYLHNLNLSNCELNRVLPGTSNPALLNLDLSWNKIGGKYMQSLLQPHMVSLNASGSTCSDKSSITELLSQPNFSLATLDTLELASCNLCDFDFSQILTHLSNLTRFIVNDNYKLSKASLIKVLQHKPTLSYINISGCSEITESPDLETEISSPEICTLVVSMAVNVRQSWLTLWCGQGAAEALPHGIVMFKPC